MTIVGRVSRTVVLERIEGEDDVLGRDRLAVLPFRLGAQPVGRRRDVARKAHRLGQQPVGGVRLVERFRHQGVEHLSDRARDIAFHAGDDGIEIVERAAGRHAHRARLGGVRIDVVEMLETLPRSAARRGGRGHAARARLVPPAAALAPPPACLRKDRAGAARARRRRAFRCGGWFDGSGARQASGTVGTLQPSTLGPVRGMIMSDFGDHRHPCDKTAPAAPPGAGATLVPALSRERPSPRRR